MERTVPMLSMSERSVNMASIRVTPPSAGISKSISASETPRCGREGGRLFIMTPQGRFMLMSSSIGSPVSGLV